MILVVLLALAIASVTTAQTINVTTSADVTDVPGSATINDLPGPDGVVSFREALLASDNTSGHQTVGFEIPEHDWYLSNIYPGQVLLQGSFSFSATQPVTIDGATQTAFTGDTFAGGNEVILPLQTYLGGDGTIVTGLHDTRVEVSGSFSNIFGNTGGMYIVVYFGIGSIISDNEAWTIKVDQSNDNVIVRNTTSRVRIDGWFGGNTPAVNNRVGGPDPVDRNYITGYGGYGEHGRPGGTTVELFDTVGTLIQNNYIGTTPDGMSIGNNGSTVGISIESNNHDLKIYDNLIAIRGLGVGQSAGIIYGQAIYLEAYGGYTGNTQNVEVFGNTMGLDAIGQPVLGAINGITVANYAHEYVNNVRIGGPEPGQGNVIAGYQSTGIYMEISPGVPPVPGAAIRISGNSIFDNGEIGIDLMPNTWTTGPTPNDPLDADVGANWLQNYPEISSAMTNGSTLQIAGQLHSEPLNSYSLEFFASPICDPSGIGQAEIFLGTTNVTTDANGDATFDVALTVAVPVGWVVTSTATREPLGATSEFSACMAVTAAPETPLMPEGMKMLDGLRNGGQLADLFASDGDYLPLDPSPTTNPAKQKVHLVLQSTSPVATPAGIDFRLSGHKIGGAEGDVIQTVGLWNYNTGSYELVDTRAATNSDQSIQIPTTGDSSRFVHPITGEMTAGVKWTIDSFAGRPFIWSVNVDEAIWLIEE